MIIIQLIIFLFLFLTPIEGPPKRKPAGAGPSNRATEVIVPDNLDETHKNMYKKRIEWINKLEDDKDKYNVFVENGEVKGIYCNRCDKPVNFHNKNHFQDELFSHNDAHKMIQGISSESADAINNRFENMKEIKTKLGKNCLTIIKASGYFVCEVCKSIHDDIRNSVFNGRDIFNVKKHINSNKHKNALNNKEIDVNNLPEDMIFPVAEDARQYYRFCKYPDYRKYVFNQQNPNDNLPQYHAWDKNNPLYGKSTEEVNSILFGESEFILNIEKAYRIYSN